MNQVPLLIEFARNTTLHRQPTNTPRLPIVQNGPPGTFVIFSDGSKVPLPTDQIVESDDSSGAAVVGFGGMDFGGMDFGGTAEEHLVFHRVRELKPEALLSPERGRKMTLSPRMVAAIHVNGVKVWPKAAPAV